MIDKRGKYYWVRTEVGREIAFKRDSGAWEMHGIDCTEDLRELILEVYEEVANGLNKQPEKALAIQGVMHQRELLIAFFDSVDDTDIDKQKKSEGWKVVDDYLKAINCA